MKIKKEPSTNFITCKKKLSNEGMVPSRLLRYFPTIINQLSIIEVCKKLFKVLISLKCSKFLINYKEVVI